MTCLGITPRMALDFPDLNDSLWVIWSGNADRWPDARRTLAYLSEHRRHVLQDWALFEMDCRDAATFETEAAARAFLAENEAKRPAPYSEVVVSTVAHLKRAKGFSE